MNGFSLSLKGQGRKPSKVKKKGARPNVFGEQNNGRTKSVIKLTHVDEYQETKDKKNELVIKPVGILKSQFDNTNEDGTHNGEITKQKFGFIKMTNNSTASGPNDNASLIKALNKSDNIQPRWLDELPEITQEQEYDEVPVEEFGDALLRGMGWDGKDDKGGQTSEDHGQKGAPPHRTARQQYSGIGAKVKINDNNKGNKFAEETFLPLVKISRETGKPI